MVLLGGVSIFGGSGSICGVLLSILIVLNLRNGMSLANLTGHIQTGVIGVLLILSVLVPNLVGTAREALNRRRHMAQPQEAAAQRPNLGASALSRWTRWLGTMKKGGAIRKPVRVQEVNLFARPKIVLDKKEEVRRMKTQDLAYHHAARGCGHGDGCLWAHACANDSARTDCGTSRSRTNQGPG